MANYLVNVGNVYERVTFTGNLEHRSKLTIKSVDGDAVVAKSASGKVVATTVAEVKTWKLLDYKKKTLVRERKRLNTRTCLEVAIDTIIAHNCGMSADAIVEAMKTEGTFKFQETAKTPGNSVSSRLNSYIRDNDNPKVKHIESADKKTRGLFYPADYELTAEVAEA